MYNNTSNLDVCKKIQRYNVITRLSQLKTCISCLLFTSTPSVCGRNFEVMADNGITFVKSMNLPNSPEIKAHLRKDGRCLQIVDEFKKFYPDNQEKVDVQVMRKMRSFKSLSD